MKRAINLFLSLMFVLSLTTVPVSAAGDTMATATQINFDTEYNGTLSETNKTDFYKITLSSSGRVNFRLKAYFAWSYYDIYDENGRKVWDKHNVQWDSGAQELNLNVDIDLTSGIYYLSVNRETGNGKYNFRLSFTDANESFKETTGGVNNTLQSASEIALDTTYNGQTACNDSKDIYKFTLRQSEK